MRVIGLILSLYFVALAIMPCGDAEHCSGEGKVDLVSLSDPSCHDSNHQEESCSPLCLCHCCGGITLIYDHSPEFVFEIISSIEGFYLDNSASELSFSIWQPPKIS